MKMIICKTCGKKNTSTIINSMIHINSALIVKMNTIIANAIIVITAVNICPNVNAEEAKKCF